MRSWFTVLTSCLLLFSSINADPCRFEHEKGVIDISSLGRSDGKAQYPDKLPSGSSYKFSYNPCRPFNEPPNCNGVAACQVSQDGLYSFDIGMQASAVWSAGAIGGFPSVTYQSANKEKTTIIQLQCPKDSSTDFEALGEGPTNTYKFRLTDKCACWDGCGGSPGPTTKSPGGGGSSGLPGGAVFIIILVVVFFVYFVGFAAFYRFRHQRTGTELIAHRTFWVSLPGYAKEGAVYAYRRVLNKGDTYQSV